MKKTTHTNQTAIDANTKLAEAVFKPILFSTPMVQAIIRGEKTQTRRIIKLQENEKIEFDNSELRKCFLIVGNGYIKALKCPYKIGDILWVRETFVKCNDGFIYRADHFGDKVLVSKTGKTFDKSVIWKPSLFMPKDACRIFLELNSIRIQRLNEINEADALAEGVERWTEERMKSKPTHYKLYFHEKGSECSYTSCPIDSYETLWQKINGENSWSENPFVWAYTFKEVERPYGFC